jgi:hypothetical protein
MLKIHTVPNLAQAPLLPGEDTGGVSVSVFEGTGTLFDVAASVAAGEIAFNEDVPLTSTRFTRGDLRETESAEAQENNLAVYDSFSRLTDPEETVLTASTIRVAFDRNTSELVNCCGANVDGDEVTFEGINPLKFPFFVDKTTYQYFDATLLQAVPIEYVGEEELFGLNTYIFEQTIPPTQYAELELPGSLIGVDEETVTGQRLYANKRTLWVDPVTGAVIKGQEEQEQTLEYAGQQQAVLVQAQLTSPDDAVQTTVDDTKSSSNLLGLLNGTVPLIAVILGIVCVVVAIVLARQANDEPEEATYDEQFDDYSTA